MTGAVASFLVDTLVWTGALIAFVLLIRRPVGRHFGPQIAYALWALPMLRLLMPPVTLPAWMAPAEAPPSIAQTVILLPAEASGAAPSMAAAPAIGLSEILLALWLGGALALLVWRVREYRAMRADLLAQARPVGEAGPVRLVETPAVTAPVAFGILDKVVALPPLFMAQPDRIARDMAIAHELAHHRGHDLVANAAAQPLLALHWFNPLAWWGWRAMRRDQEAACDARVVAGRDRGERATYAEVIAGFAAGEHLALAAPMACPVLGETSIVHRLRSLTMSDISAHRRKSGLAAIAATALAVPMTATVSYALPDMPQDVAAPPAPPAPPEAPQASTPPEAPQAPGEIEHTVELDVSAVDGEEWRRFENEHARELAELDAETVELEAELAAMHGGHIEVEVRTALADMERARDEVRREMRIVRRTVPVMAVEVDCDEEGEAVIERDLGNGQRAMVICREEILGSALAGIEAARDAIARDANLSAAQRERVLRELDRTLAEMKARHESASATSDVQGLFAWEVAPVRVGYSAQATAIAVRSAVVTGEDCEDEPAPRTI